MNSFCGWLPWGVVDGRAFDRNRRFLVPWKVGDGWFVDAASGINVDGIYNFGQHFRRLIGSTVLRLVLPSGSEKKTPIWCECQSAEE